MASLQPMCKGDGVTALKWQISKTYQRDHVANWLMCTDTDTDTDIY